MGNFGEFRKVLWYFSIWFKGWAGNFADFLKVMMGSISKSTDPLPYMYLILGGVWCARNFKSLSLYQYRSIEGSGEAGSEGVMKEKCSVYKTGHVYLIWCINTVRRTGFLLVSIIVRRCGPTLAQNFYL